MTLFVSRPLAIEAVPFTNWTSEQGNVVVFTIATMLLSLDAISVSTPLARSLVRVVPMYLPGIEARQLAFISTGVLHVSSEAGP